MTTSSRPLERDALASTRLAPQDRDEGYVIRQSLLGRLDDVLAHRLTIVHAGAGYGKTSLLIQWFKALRSKRIAAAWLTLGEDEAVASTCLAHIIAAVASPGYIDQALVTSLGRLDDKMPVSSMAAAFVNAVAAQTRPLVILLDEYNRAQSDATDALFRALLRSTPHHVHIVIASRWQPDIDAENLRAHGDLVEISAADLRFSRAEIAQLLADSGAQLDEQEMLRLTDRTEGWPIAVQMARLWLNGDGRKARLVSDFSGRTSDLASYLTEQVLCSLAQEAQDFLMQTAILERVNGDIANAITGRRDGWLMLEDLHERDLFLIPESDDRQWFRYHTLLLDYLRDRLMRCQADTVLELHRRAAAWLAANGFLNAAVHHAMKADDHALAAKLLSDAGGWRLIMDGRMTLIRRGIDGLPEEIVRSHLPLALARAFLLVKAGDIKGGRDYFSNLDDESDVSRADRDRTDLQIVGHILDDYADEPATLAGTQRLQELRKKIPRQDHVIQAVLSDSLATKYCEFGLFRQSLEACEDAISRYRILGSLYGEIFLRFTQARAHLARGRLEEAESILRQTGKELEMRFGEGMDLSAHTSIYLAEVLAESCRMDEAAAQLRDSLPVAEQSDGWYELYAAACTAAAAIAWADSGLDATLAAIERARSIAAARGFERLTLLADYQTVHYLCLGGRTEQATRHMLQLEQADGISEARVNRLGAFGAACRGMIQIAHGRYDEAELALAARIEAAESSGDVRLFISLALLLTDALACAGRTGDAAKMLDRAVRSGLFTGIKRPYMEYGRRLSPLIDLVLRGECHLPPDRYRDVFLRDLRRDLLRLERRQASEGIVLTAAEREVLVELDRGFSNKEIARRLGISPNTVKYRVKSLFAKLGVAERNDAVRVSRERALLSTHAARP